MKDIADIMIHVHPDLLSVQRERLEEEVRVLRGVITVCFGKKVKHELAVIYNPESINSEKILKRVKQWDKDAVIF